MKTKITDFLSGFFSPLLIEKTFEFKYWNLNFLFDQVVFVTASIATGILVAILKDMIFSRWKKIKK